jgi:hypothetical protein
LICASVDVALEGFLDFQVFVGVLHGQLLAAIAVVALIDCLGWTTARTLRLGGSIGRWDKRVVRRRVQLHGVEP